MSAAWNRFTHFYPRSPCGERLPQQILLPSALQISIHALLAESDDTRPPNLSLISDFYPRSPCGERRGVAGNVQRTHSISIHALLAESDLEQMGAQYGVDISIHALLAESDSTPTTTAVRWRYFYPRSPCGERPRYKATPPALLKFLSTLSLRRATSLPRLTRRSLRISIHALLAESDASTATARAAAKNFYPRSPCGERRRHRRKHPGLSDISIHALLAESDDKGGRNR